MSAVKREEKEQEILQRHYYDAQSIGSYGGVKRLINVTKVQPKNTKKWLSSQLTYSLHKPARRRFPRRKYVTRGLDFQHQADLVEMQPWARENSGYRYLITVIDVFSRYAWAKPLRRKTAEDTARVLMDIYNTSGRIPQLLQTDAGKEFENKPVRDYLTTIGVEQFSLASPMKAALVERFNRTLKERMWRIFTKQGSYKWLDILPKVVHSYNHTPHRSLNGRSPAEVNKSNESNVWLQQYGKKQKRKRKPKFAVGDRVRISKAKSIFEKGYLPNWTEEEFFVKSVDTKYSPVMYELHDHNNEVIRGRFYEPELQHVINKENTYRIERVIRTRGQGSEKEALVKWKGYKDPEWISHKAIVHVDQQ